MKKVTGEELQELYEDTAGQFDYTKDRFNHIAAVINKQCEESFLSEVVCICEQQLQKLREKGM